jgi:signal transduction histidine kinase
MPEAKLQETEMPEARIEDRVMVLAPSGRDAALIAGMLGRDGIPCVPIDSAAELAVEARQGAALAVVAAEALINVSVEPIVAMIRAQPPWSDLPVILLTSSGARESETGRRLLAVLGPVANVTLLERPVRVATLLSSVRSALRARRRQYEVREYLAELRRIDEELLQTQKLESLGVLAGGVAHDFNNLLTGIIGNASLALDMLPSEYQPVAPILQDVLTASQSAADLTRQLLAYAGKGRFVVEPMNLSATVKSVSHLVQSSIPSNVDMQLDLDPKLPYIDADKTQIHQIVMNLLINAAEAIPKDQPGAVHISTQARHIDECSLREMLPANSVEPGHYVQVEVRDNGAGMDEATKARIFDPFFTTKFMGRGLGLAAALGIVRGHKGALTVESSPGAGSCFRILFPASECQDARHPWQQRGHENASKPHQTVLVIDDEPTVLRVAKAALESHGYDILLAASGNEGIETFRGMPHKINAVLLDLTMPGMNAHEVLNRLKAIRNDVKVVLSSGFNESEVIRLFAGKELAGFIQKPYTSGALARKITEALA